MDTSKEADGADKNAPAKLLCWGCGEFGQHCQGHTNDASFRESEVNHFGRGPGTLGPVQAVACGASHTAILTDSGEVYVWGNGNSGQLGCGDQNPRFKPTQVSLSPEPPQEVRVRALACGSRHTMVLLDNGYVYSFGNNFYAQLGYNFREKNYKENQLRPQFLEFLKHRPVREVSCGDKHSLFLFEDGTVAVVGNNAHGQIGDGTRAESTVPKPVELEDPVSHVTCGPNHSLVITENGSVFAWGYGKACGRRKDDVLVPEHIDFKGRHIVQVAGGSTHSLALTAGGKVYAWGFGTDGQLGLGTIVMATKPRRLRHNVLEEGVSCVACGDSFSAVVTVSGRLYMWGKNSHTIEYNQGSQRKVLEPYCLNPEPASPVRHVVCGAWHAAALSGTPGPLPEREDSDSENEDADTGSVYSTLSSTPSLQGDKPASDDSIGAPPEWGLEVSAPPQSTTQRPTPASKRPAFPNSRAKTKLTLGEFYATSESSRSEKNSSPEEASPGRARSTASKLSSSSTAKIVVVEVPAAPLDPESDVEEPLPVSTQDEAIQDDDDNEVTFQKVHHGSHNPEELDAHGALPAKREFHQSKPLLKEKTTVASKQQKAEFPAIEPRAPPQSRQGEDGVGRHAPFAVSKSRATFISVATPTVQVSKTPAKNYMLPREHTVLASKNMDILDASQLLTSCGSDKPSTKSGAAPGRPYGVEQGGSGHHHYYDSYGANAGLYSSLDSYDWDNFDDDFLMSSPRAARGNDVTLQHVPMKQIDGDFGPQVKRSSTFFGALSGHVSRSPTKFFRKPTPSGSLSRSPSTMTFTSHTSNAPTPFGRYNTFGTLVGGGAESAGGVGVGGGGCSRPGTRGLGVGISVGIGSSGGSREANVVGSKNVKLGSGGGNAPPQRNPSGSIQSYRRGEAGRGGQHGNTGDQNASRKAPVFSSATSWRQRQPDLPDDWDAQSQSAPASSKTRKQVAFADGGHSPRSVGVSGGSKPTLAAAMAAVTPIVSVKPAFLTVHHADLHSAGHGRHETGADNVTGGSQSRDPHQSRDDRDLHDEGAVSSGNPADGTSLQASTGGHNVTTTNARKPQPALAYRTLSENKQNPPKRTTGHSQGNGQGKPVGLQSLLASGAAAAPTSGPKPALTSVSGQGRSRTQLLISGAGDRSRRAHFN